MTRLPTLQPPQRSRQAGATQRRRDRLAISGWSLIAILCFGTLILLLSRANRHALFHRSFAPTADDDKRTTRIVPPREIDADPQPEARDSAPGGSRFTLENTNPIRHKNDLPQRFAITGSDRTTLAAASGIKASTRTAPPGSIRINHISPSIVTSPRYLLIDSPGKPFVPGTWIQVEVEFAADANVPSRLDITFTIDIAGTLYPGEFHYARIFPGSPLYAVAFLRPQALAPHLRRGATVADLLRNVRIDVRSDGTLLDSAALRDEATASKAPLRLGYIVDAADTPFFILLGDRYETPDR